MATRLVRANVASEIGKALADLKAKNNFDVRYAESFTKDMGSRVSKSTFSRILRANGSLGRLEYRTAKTLVAFINLQGGDINERGLFEDKGKDFHGANLAGEDLSGEDLNHANFAYANLENANLSGANLHLARMAGANLKGANLTGVKGSRVDLCNAKMAGVIVADTKLDRWDFTGCNFDDALLKNLYISYVRFIGADMRNAKFKRLVWRTTGWQTRGILLPPFDPNELIEAHDCHDTIAHLFMWEFPDDLEMRQIAEFIKARLFFGCWANGIQRWEEVYPHRLDEIEAMFHKYDDNWKLHKRYISGRETLRCKSLKDWESLVYSPFYSDFKTEYDKMIRWAREAYRAGTQDLLFAVYDAHTGLRPA